MSIDGVMLEAGGRRIPLKFDWAAISDLHGHYGVRWQTSIDAAVAAGDPKELATILSFGSTVSAVEWIELSPPLHDAIVALDKALRVALFGPSLEPAEGDAPGEAESPKET